MADLPDDAILLAGATGRIGAATLTKLVREGARVVVVSRDAARASAVIETALEPAVRERAIECGADLGDEDAAVRAVALCVQRFGRIDALVNLAGS